MVPVKTTFATALPEIEPNKLDATIATFAGPPRNRPKSLNAKSVMNSRPPMIVMISPSRKNPSTMVDTTHMATPNMALAST